MSFDEKEKLMLEHYRKVIESDLFDEYDILGFLIFIRRHIKGEKYELIAEFADLVAHRGRDRGIVMNAIQGAIDNDYKPEEGSTHIKGYHGIYYVDWKAKWVELGKEYKIKLSDARILDITVCIFSLAQFTEYRNGKYKGHIEIFQQNHNELFLATIEDGKGSPYINFAMCNSLVFVKEYLAGHISGSVETVRIDKILRLKDKDGFII